MAEEEGEGLGEEKDGEGQGGKDDIAQKFLSLMVTFLDGEVRRWNRWRWGRGGR